MPQRQALANHRRFTIAGLGQPAPRHDTRHTGSIPLFCDASGWAMTRPHPAWETVGALTDLGDRCTPR